MLMPHCQKVEVSMPSICRVLGVRALLAGPGLLFGQTSSPFQPPAEALGLYVVNSGPGLDTSCTYRSGGPLIVQVKVPATMNEREVNADGTLSNSAKLVGSKIVGATARVRFPVFDIDSSGMMPGAQPETDKVTFNGKVIKNLQGVTDQWTDDSLTIPISDIKFDSPRSRGVVNELKIDIDQANIGAGEFWCMSMDWVAIEFDAAAPIVLFHGINATASSWDQGDSPGFIAALDAAGVLWERFTTGTNARSITNAADLTAKVGAFLAPLKAGKVNIIAHSKGGLDAQMMKWRGPPFKILSLTTFVTPHLGSPAADLSIVAYTAVDDRINVGADPGGWVSTYVDQWTFGQGPQLPGLRDLTTYQATAAIAAGMRGNISPTFTIATDADGSGNFDLELAESAGLFPAAAHYVARRSWVVVAIVASAPIIRVAVVPGAFGGFFGTTRTQLTYRANIVGYRPNDIVVSVPSAHPAYGTPFGTGKGFNHATIKQGFLATGVLPLILPLR